VLLGKRTISTDIQGIDTYTSADPLVTTNIDQSHRDNQMTNTIRWTVRGIRPETLEMLATVRQTSEGTFGEYINMAVAQWYDLLPDAAEEDDEAAA
jgi:hypothetical protein